MIEIHSNRNLSKNQIFVGFVGENKAEKIEFVIPEYLEKYSKKIIFQPENGEPYCKLFDNITSNIYTLTREETQYEELDCCIQFFNVENEDEIIYKTSMLHIIFDKSLSCDDDVSEDEPQVLLLDELIAEVNKAINQTNNLDIDIEENTIIVTKKDGSTESVNVGGGSGGGTGGTSDYRQLSNKPTINNIKLNGDLTAKDLGLQPEGDYASSDDIPKNVSELNNDAGYLTEHQDLKDYALKTEIPDTSSFITKEVSDLSNYYNKNSIDEMIGNIETLLGGI